MQFDAYKNRKFRVFRTAKTSTIATGLWVISNRMNAQCSCNHTQRERLLTNARCTIRHFTQLELCMSNSETTTTSNTSLTATDSASVDRLYPNMSAAISV